MDTKAARDFADVSARYTGAEVRLWVHGLCDEVDALRKDAERYRWLRDKAPGEIVFDHTHGKSDGGNRFVLCVPFDGEPIDNDAESSARMDASIDAAMAADAPGAA